MVKIRLKTTGSFPIQLTIDKLGKKEINSETNSIDLSYKISPQFRITEVQNICGMGTFDAKVVIVMPPLGNEISNEGKWKVFPNPANSFLILYHPYSNVFGKINIFTLDGKIAKSFERMHFKDNNTEISLKGINSGSYIIKVETDSGNYSTRIVIK